MMFRAPGLWKMIVAAFGLALIAIVWLANAAPVRPAAGASGAKPAASGPAARGPGGPPATVFAEAVIQTEFATRVEAIGTLDARERVDLSPTAADRVTAIGFQDGERVKAGKTLFVLAQREQAALVDQAAAELAQARQELARLEPLANQGAVSKSELDVARRNADAAAASLRAMQSRQRDRVIVAPFDGVLGFRNVSEGAYVRPGDVLATLVDDSVMKLDFPIPSIYLQSVKPGTPIAAQSDDAPGQQFSGTVATVDNAINPVTRAVRVRAMIPNSDGVLVAGMFVRVSVLAEPRRVPSVPERALQPSGPDVFVWTLDNSTGQTLAKRVKITAGQRENGRVEVLAGLSTGDQIIVDGMLRVREGAPVTPGDPASIMPVKAGAAN